MTPVHGPVPLDWIYLFVNALLPPDILLLVFLAMAQSIQPCARACGVCGVLLRRLAYWRLDFVQTTEPYLQG